MKINMNKSLRVAIINADDFGMSKENVDVILDCFTNGAVSSISMFAAMPGSTYGFSQLKKSKLQGVGVHLSFTCGIPFLSSIEIPSLVNKKGEFYSAEDLKIHLRNIKPNELKNEFKAQIEAIRSHTEITHLDNHRPEIYFRPDLFGVVIELAVEQNLPIRLPFDDRFNKTVASHLAKMFEVDSDLAFHLGESHLKKCSDLNICRTNFYIQPNFDSLGINKTKELIADLPTGVTEICTHPGERPIEHQIWRDKVVRDVILKENIQLINYSDLRMFLC